MDYAAAILAASFFMLALRALQIPAITGRVVATGREAAQVMGDRVMDDADKERLLQGASLRMLGAFASISLRTVLSVVAALVPLLALHAAGVTELTAVGETLASWQGIAVTGLAMSVVCLVKVPS